MGGISIFMRRRGIQANPLRGKYEKFADPEVFRVLMERGVSSDGIGITLEDILNVKSIAIWFYNNKVVKTFDELERFTSISELRSQEGSGLGTFEECSNLYSLRINDKVILIGGRTFLNCKNLIYINVPNKARSIGTYAYRNVPAKMIINCPELETLGNLAFAGSGVVEIINLGKITQFTSSDGSGLGAFYQCLNLKKAVLPKSLQTISSYTFSGCENLSNVEGLENVRTIGNYAFSGCNNLIFDVLDLSNVVSLSQNAFNGVRIRKIIFKLVQAFTDGTSSGTSGIFGVKTALEEIVLPDTLVRINAYLLTGYTSLVRCNIPQSVQIIYRDAFNSVPAPLVVNLPYLQTISATVFANSGCVAIDDLGIITAIGDGLCRNCYNLQYAILPETLVTMATFAFENCVAMKYVIVKSKVVPTIGRGNFDGTSNCPIYVIDSLVDAYKVANNWANYAPRITSIYYHLGYLEFESPSIEAQCVSLYGSDGKVTIEQAQAVTGIAEGAFQQKGSGKFFELRHFKNITYIGTNAFRNSGITHIAIPENTTQLHWGAFFQCGALRVVKIYALTPPTLAASVFASNASDRKIYVPDVALDAYKSATTWKDYVDYILPFSEYTE